MKFIYRLIDLFEYPSPTFKQAITDLMMVLSVGIILAVIFAGYVTIDKMTP